MTDADTRHVRQASRTWLVTRSSRSRRNAGVTSLCNSQESLNPSLTKSCGCCTESPSTYRRSRYARVPPLMTKTLILAYQVHTFYEAVGYMISAQPNKPPQEKLIAKLMELPNNAVRAAPAP